MDDAGLLELRIAVIDLVKKTFDKGDRGADVGKREETRAQAVVHIVRVISDVVGDRGRLRLEAWLAAEVERLEVIVLEDRVGNSAFPVALAWRAGCVRERPVVLDEPG